MKTHQLYVPYKYTVWKTKEIKTKWVHVGNVFESKRLGGYKLIFFDVMPTKGEVFMFKDKGVKDRQEIETSPDDLPGEDEING